jgi:glutamate-5-semialdehyde dehydrogenase
MELKEYIVSIVREAKSASSAMRVLDTERKNKVLGAAADLIGRNRGDILRANKRDLENGEKKGLSRAFLDRLELNDSRIDGMVGSLREIQALEDPVGAVSGVRRPQGFLLEKVRVPIGVVAMIYESRPNVTVDAAALCLKSGNAVVLRGGSEAMESNKALTAIVRRALEAAGLPGGAVQLIERSEHQGVDLLVSQDGWVDLVIPRGGERLIRAVVDAANVPVIKHYKGVCHLYVDRDADLDMALEVVHNAKVQRPSTCNALETLLVHGEAAGTFLPRVKSRLDSVELRGCGRTREILEGIGAATEEDWFAEFLDYVLAVRVVDSLEQAVEHIQTYGSSHTDGILSRDVAAVERFVQAVDSAVVTVNSSTRLSDGGVFGLGAEIGISTDKLHARGPMGIGELTTYKWVVRGYGHLRQ